MRLEPLFKNAHVRRHLDVRLVNIREFWGRYRKRKVTIGGVVGEIVSKDLLEDLRVRAEVGEE